MEKGTERERERKQQRERERERETYHGKLEAAKRKTKSSVLDRPSICTNSSVFILLLPSCSLVRSNYNT
jgi:hypothetical protein